MDYSGPQRNGAVYGEEPPHYGGYYEAEQGNYGSNDNIDVSTRLKHDSSSSEGLVCVSLAVRLNVLISLVCMLCGGVIVVWA